MKLHWLVASTAFAVFTGYFHYWDLSQELRSGPDPLLTKGEPYDHYRFRNGGQEAVADFSRGRLRLVGLGLPRRSVVEFQEILLRDYGIEYKRIAGCVVTDSITRYAADYNRVMEAKIAEKFGVSAVGIAWVKSEQLQTERFKSHSP